MKNVLLIVLTITLFASCGIRNNKNKNGTATSMKKENAVKYYKRAQKLGINPTTGRDSILKAVALLDSATALNSEYIQAYLAKQSYQVRLGEHENALKTIKILENLKPDDAEIKSLEGFYYLLNNDTQSAKVALIQANSLWDNKLDTISKNNDFGLLGILVGKATNLKLLGNETKSNLIYKRILNDTIFDKKKYKGLKKDVDSLFLNKSKEDFYNYLVRGIKKNKSPIR